MKQPCPSQQHYAQDPQDEQTPDYYMCEHCGAGVHEDFICRVPTEYQPPSVSEPHLFINCCADCYDAVCEEEAYNPEED